MESKLPEEIQKQIRKEAEAYMNYRLKGMVHDEIYPDQLITAYDFAASEWAQWKVKHDELKGEYIDLGKRHNTAQTALTEQAFQYQALKERCDKMEADYNNQRLINYNLKVVLGTIAMQKTCEEQENDPEAIEGSDGSKLGDIEYAYDHIITDAREALKEGESNTPAAGGEEKEVGNGGE